MIINVNIKSPEPVGYFAKVPVSIVTWLHDFLTGMFNVMLQKDWTFLNHISGKTLASGRNICTPEKLNSDSYSVEK